MGRRNIFIILVLLAVLGLIIWVILAQKNGGGIFSGLTGPGSSKTATSTWQKDVGNVTVPNKGGTAPSNVAVPQTQTAAGPNTAASYRSFNLSVDSSAWTPNTVIVKKGDTVHLNITTSGSGLDFTQPDYGLKAQLASGKQSIVEFQATASGKFTFYCSACGGPDKGPVGYVVVSP